MIGLTRSRSTTRPAAARLLILGSYLF